MLLQWCQWRFPFEYSCNGADLHILQSRRKSVCCNVPPLLAGASEATMPRQCCLLGGRQLRSLPCLAPIGLSQSASSSQSMRIFNHFMRIAHPHRVSILIEIAKVDFTLRPHSSNIRYDWAR